MSIQSKSIEYSHDLDTAAFEVTSELDDTDGVVFKSVEYYELLRSKAMEHRVYIRDLHALVRELLDDK